MTTPVPAPRRSILVADDEPHIGRIIKTKLEQGPFAVELVYDGAEALEALARDPDAGCVILDLMMPRVTGLEVLERLRAERKALAIVADEFGGTAGLITVGDLLDELLGETGDEFKPKENAPQRLADGRVRLPGALRLDEATQWVGVHWEADAYTVGGLVMERLGRLPVAGDVLDVDGVRIEVEKLRGRAVEWLVATPKVKEAGDD